MPTTISNENFTSDVERWSDTSKLSLEWDHRAKEISEWIPEGVKLIDIGCGQMAVEKVVKNCTYIPVDIVQRDHRTTVVDLNVEPLPSSLIKKTDFAVLLGVMEYLKRPQDLLSMLSAAGIQVVCSYQLADNSSAEVRAENGWFNAFTALEFAKLLRDSGFSVVQSKRMGEQGLYLLRPSKNQIVSSFSQGTSERASTSIKPRSKLVLSGFFGRGNVGDEALLQVQYETFSKYFDIIISVEQRGAFDGYWNWYPYDQCQIIHQAEQAIFQDPSVIGLHIGGGDLPLGFNAGQVVAAIGCGKTVTASGIDFGCTYESARKLSPATLQTYLSWIKPSIRSRQGFEMAKEVSQEVHFGTDWGLQLPVDGSDNIPEGRVLLTLREFPSDRVTPELRDSLLRCIEQIELLYGKPTLVPFCPEDERFLNSLESTWGLPRELHWWNPRRMKQLIAKSKLVISVGRFHPLVFSSSTCTPCVFTEWDANVADGQKATSSHKNTSKAMRFCVENEIPYFANLRELTQSLANLKVNARRPALCDEHFQRFDSMVARVLQQLGVKV
jgi:Methyltransferase domain